MGRIPSALLAGLLMAVAPLGSSRVFAERPPNVVLILADDLGYGDLGCYGQTRYATPRLDALAAQGVRFTQFNTPAPFCAPTRASLLTGRYPTRCGLASNPTPDGAPEANAMHLPLGEVLLPQLFGQAGYATAMIGKWHLGHLENEWQPTARGFQEYLGILYSNDMRPVELREGTELAEYPVDQTTLTRRYTERALQFIERHQQKPFLLYLAHAMPHKPLACSLPFRGRSGAGLYGDVIAELDDSVGQILDRLDALQLADDTLVIFTSDNGPWFGGHTGGLRGMKGTSWEGGSRVPCLLRWPGHDGAPRVVDQVCVMMDLFSTVLAAASIAPPADRVIDGVNLLPHLAGKPFEHERVVIGQQGARLATIRDTRWKLHLVPQAPPPPPGTPSPPDRRAPDGKTILAPLDQATREQYPGIRTGDSTVAYSLFDLAHDPAEQHDVSHQHPDQVARLRTAFERYQAEVSPPGAGR